LRGELVSLFYQRHHAAAEDATRAPTIATEYAK
jgi:hypothetical protein